MRGDLINLRASRRRRSRAIPRLRRVPRTVGLSRDGGDGGGVLLADVQAWAGGPRRHSRRRSHHQMAGARIESLYTDVRFTGSRPAGDRHDGRPQQRAKNLRATLGTRGASPAACRSKPESRSKKRSTAKAFQRYPPADIRRRKCRGVFQLDGTKLIYQATPPGAQCDQEFVLDLKTGESKRVSSGKGRTTCGYFVPPKDDRIIYSSTEAGGADCPPAADRSKGYVWAVYPTYDIYEANPDGSNAHRLTTTDGYDAESTWCAKGGKFVFTSDRDGDLELYEMNDKGDVKRLTNSPGYDGGAFYSRRLHRDRLADFIRPARRSMNIDRCSHSIS